MAALALQLRAQHRIHNSRTLVHLFSSSSSSDDKNDTPPSPPPVSSLLSEVRASLRQSPPPMPHRLSQSPPLSHSQSKFRTLSEIRENLSKFPAQTAPPQPTTLQELYERNMARMGGEGVTSTAGGAGMEGTKATADFESIRRSLRNFRPTETEKAKGADRFNNNAFNPLSLDSYKQSLKIKPNANIAGTSSPVISVSGGSGSQTQTAASPFSSGKGFKGKSDSKSELSNFVLLRDYKYEELGERLRKLRPANATIGKNCFSLSELKERLQKLREIEEKESVSSIGGLSFADLRSSLMSMHQDVEEKNKKSSAQRSDILGHLSGTPKHMLSPPKEQLVEKFFHPDNMSSAEKLKLELEKVREEFKMSESDCGSARVQVAQLTTKIKHLSSVLHKKDKHSRKGLQDMVQRRKKHLRYLRRTDWDSYCLCLSKLGLRDNPDYKN